MGNVGLGFSFDYPKLMEVTCLSIHLKESSNISFDYKFVFKGCHIILIVKNHSTASTTVKPLVMNGENKILNRKLLEIQYVKVLLCH